MITSVDAVRRPESLAAAVQPEPVLFLAPDLELAGPELRLLDFARRFPKSLQVHICALAAGGELEDELRTATAHVHLVPIERVYAEWRQVRRVFAYVRQHRVAIVNSIDFKTLLLNAAIKLRFGRRVRTVHHFVSLLDNWEPRHQLLLPRLLKYIDVLVCNSEVVAEETLDAATLRGRTCVIKNGVDLQHFRRSGEAAAAVRAEIGWAPEDFVIGTVANIRPVKNYPLLIRGFRRVHALCPRTRLLCVGDGDQRVEIEALVRNAGLQDKVFFSGSVRDVRPYLESMDAFVLCSRKEGFPNVVLQAMAMEVPVIASAVGETTRLIDDGETGLLFDPPDLDLFVAALVRLAGDQSLCERLARNGRALVEAHYSQARMIDGYVDLYRSLGVGASPSGMARRPRRRWRKSGAPTVTGESGST